MKNIILLLAISLFTLSCDDEERYGLEDFYDAYLIDDIFLEADKTIFFDGDPPVNFIVRANEESTENDIFYFDARIVVDNKDTLEGKEFLPTESGRYNIKAVVNNLESNVIAVDYIDKKDISSIKLEYLGYDQLTTYPWSRTGDFILTGTLQGSPRIVNLSKSTIPVTFTDGSSTITREGHHFDAAGTYDAYVEVNGLRSETHTFTVREQKEYEELSFPIIYHFINKAPDQLELERAIKSYNEIFANENIVLNRVFLVNQWENPSWVNANMKFELAANDPEGNALENPGVNLVSAFGDDEIENQEDLFTFIKKTNWDQNKYINIYVGDFNIPISASLPILEAEKLIGLKTADSDEIFDNDTLNYLWNGNIIYNSNTMGQYWGLYPTFQCDPANGCEIPIYDCRLGDDVGPNQGLTGAIFNGEYQEFELDNSCADDYCEDTFPYKTRYTPFHNGLGVPDLAVVGDTLDGACYLVARDCRADIEEEGMEFYLKNIMDDWGLDQNFIGENNQLSPRRIRNVITYDQRERMRFVIDHAINRPTPRNQ
jgi:hypothetical protein